MESDTVMPTVKGPLAVGVPLMIPVLAAMDNPAGNPEALQLSGVLPPEAASVRLYGEPRAPGVKDVVVMLNGGAIVKESGLVTD